MAKIFFQLEDGTQASRELNWGMTRLGRGTENDITISHPSISYYHCEVELGLDFLLIRDCQSTNGTFVNGQKVTEIRLDPGQTLRLGDVNVRVEWAHQHIPVPKVNVPKLPESVPLGDGVLSCLKHSTVPAVWHCSKCQKYFCNACIRDVHLVGRPSRKLCPACSVPVELAPWADTKPKKQTLWGRIKKSFNRTAKLE